LSYGGQVASRNHGQDSSLEPNPQQAGSTLGPSPTISGCCETAGDIRITSACAPKIATAYWSRG
jgi:hypothetical protein